MNDKSHSERSLPGGAGLALLAAALFGASTPFAKMLLGSVSPWLMAGLLYLGSGLGLLALFCVRTYVLRQPSAEAPLQRAGLPWLAGAVLAGGIAAPVLLMWGLARTAASTASLLLNLEGVFTALLAWFVFRENFDRRIALGMGLIVAGGVLLSWSNDLQVGVPWGALAIAGACLCWGLDNNLTRHVSGGDPQQVAMVKGLVAGGVNTAIALALGASLPGGLTLLATGLVGLLGYGVSLSLFILALRFIGTARTGAYFSTAPFIGAVLSVFLLQEPLTWLLLGAGALMVAGVWLHLTEKHEHWHAHEPMTHTHRHVHDEHHQHEHAPGTPPGEPHTHEHTHAPLVHSHPHYPDLHHRHRHGKD